MEMKILINKNMVEFVSEVKTFNGKNLKRASSGDNKGSIVNNTLEFLPPSLATSTQSHNSRNSTYTNKRKNCSHEGFIQTKTITGPVLKI